MTAQNQLIARAVCCYWQLATGNWQRWAPLCVVALLWSVRTLPNLWPRRHSKNAYAYMHFEFGFVLKRLEAPTRAHGFGGHITCLWGLGCQTKPSKQSFALHAQCNAITNNNARLGHISQSCLKAESGKHSTKIAHHVRAYFPFSLVVCAMTNTTKYSMHKILCYVHAMAGCFVGGSLYAFSVYAADLKSTLKLSQTQLDVTGSLMFLCGCTIFALLPVLQLFMLSTA